MDRLLLITDDAQLPKTLKAPLQTAGSQLTVAAVAAAQAEEGRLPDRADLLLLDITHGVPNPAHLCQTLRRRPTLKDVPCLLLVPDTQIKSVDWRWGFDEFVALPTNTDRLLARIQFLLWRLNRVNVQNGLKVGDLTIDFEQFTVSVKGRLVELTFKEYELLKFLATNPGKVFTRDSLLNKVWGYEYYGGTRTVDVHVRRLRSKIEDATHPFIETVRSVGYKFLSENGIAQSPPPRPAPRKVVARRRRKRG